MCESVQPRPELQARSHRQIRSGDGDYASSPSHTTGRAVFRIRRLNKRVLTPCREI